MLYRLSASKDTIVSNKTVVGQRVTGSNGGASEILQTYFIAQPAATGNILIAFQTSSALTVYSSSMSSSAYAANPISWHLTLKNVETQNPVASSFTLEIFTVERDWSEGKGHDLDYWTDHGFANFLSATNSTAWTNPGARPAAPVLSATANFDTGHEDLDVDVTNMITSANYGFWIGLSSSFLQQTGTNYYLKAFRSRQTHFPQYQPYLEARWNDTTGSYNSAFVDIVDATGVLVGSIYNLKTVYDQTEMPVLRTYLRPKNWNLSLVTTGSSEVSGTVLTNAYWRLVDNTSEEVLVPFGTGSPAYTRMSYDDQGNYFTFPMKNLVPGLVYRFDVGYYAIDGSWNVFQGSETFRVR